MRNNITCHRINYSLHSLVSTFNLNFIIFSLLEAIQICLPSSSYSSSSTSFSIIISLLHVLYLPLSLNFCSRLFFTSQCFFCSFEPLSYILLPLFCLFSYPSQSLSLSLLFVLVFFPFSLLLFLLSPSLLSLLFVFFLLTIDIQLFSCFLLISFP